MSNEQESLTLIQGWTSAIILALATLLLLHRTFTIFIVPIFTTVQNKQLGKIEDINFSDLDASDACTQIYSKLFPYPKLAFGITNKFD